MDAAAATTMSLRITLAINPINPIRPADKIFGRYPVIPLSQAVTMERPKASVAAVKKKKIKIQ